MLAKVGRAFGSFGGKILIGRFGTQKSERERERQRQRQRQRETETETETEKDREGQRGTEKQRDRESWRAVKGEMELDLRDKAGEDSEASDKGREEGSRLTHLVRHHLADRCTDPLTAELHFYPRLLLLLNTTSLYCVHPSRRCRPQMQATRSSRQARPLQLLILVLGPSYKAKGLVPAWVTHTWCPIDSLLKPPLYP